MAETLLELILCRVSLMRFYALTDLSSQAYPKESQVDHWAQWLQDDLVSRLITAKSSD